MSSNYKDEVVKKIAVIGLGYVGLPLAVEFGVKRSVVGYDVNPRRIEELTLGIDRTLECSSEQISAATHLRFTQELRDIADCQLLIITVPTPIDQAKRPDMTHLVNASQSVGRVLKQGDIVIYESTVYPGATEEVCVPILEKTSGLRFNKDFFCAYSPERINPGDKANTIATIKKIISGSTPAVTDEVDELYKSVVAAGTWRASSIKVAEAAKVIENSQRDLNIAFVNELSIIFDRIGIDTLEVLEAAGSKWNFLPFRPGLVGGHCIGIDPYYLTHKAEQLGYHPEVILAGRRMNDSMARYVSQNIIRRMLQNGIDVTRSTVGIMGVTFKDNCPDVRNSKVFDLIDELKLWGANVLLMDPWADPVETKKISGIELIDFDDCASLDSLVVAVGHQQFAQKPIETLRRYCGSRNPVLADIKSLYNKREAERAGFTVFRL